MRRALKREWPRTPWRSGTLVLITIGWPAVALACLIAASTVLQCAAWKFRLYTSYVSCSAQNGGFWTVPHGTSPSVPAVVRACLPAFRCGMSSLWEAA